MNSRIGLGCELKTFLLIPQPFLGLERTFARSARHYHLLWHFSCSSTHETHFQLASLSFSQDIKPIKTHHSCPFHCFLHFWSHLGTQQISTEPASDNASQASFRWRAPNYLQTVDDLSWEKQFQHWGLCQSISDYISSL